MSTITLFIRVAGRIGKYRRFDFYSEFVILSRVTRIYLQIPFSKFFYSSKGRIQDKQQAVPLNQITHFGFSVSAKNGMDGQFNLEIDYIGLEFDPNHREEFAYEMYRTQNYIVAT